MKAITKYLVMMIAMLAMSISLPSCGGDDVDAITVTNDSGSVVLNRFRIVFLNTNGETLQDKEYGTFSPGDSHTVEIPTGAEEYYMAAYNSRWYFSPNYSVSVTKNKLTYDGIEQWRSN